MGSSTTGTIIGIIVGLLTTLGIAFGVLYANSIGLLLLTGPGLIPDSLALTFTSAPVLQQLQMLFADFLLNILTVFILAPVIWLIGGLLGGLVVRDMIKGAAAGLIAAILAPFVCFAINWIITPGLDYNLLLLWVINGILAGLIAGVGGVIGGTLTSRIETY